MEKETRTICYDTDLKIEAYRFAHIRQPFPNHFHGYYVLGIIAEGSRNMTVKNIDYCARAGDVIVFSPYQNHACLPDGNAALSYYGLNVSSKIMEERCLELTGKKFLPAFVSPLLQDEELYSYIYQLNQLIFEESKEFQKEELFLCLIERLLRRHGFVQEDDSQKDCANPSSIEKVCSYIDENFDRHISLNDLCDIACQSKSTLLRTFTREKGVTPYRYLETVRINKARQLLEDGLNPAEAALNTGFSDQSHFNRYFTMFTGLTPALYRDILQKKLTRK